MSARYRIQVIADDGDASLRGSMTLEKFCELFEVVQPGYDNPQPDEAYLRPLTLRPKRRTNEIEEKKR